MAHLVRALVACLVLLSLGATARAQERDAGREGDAAGAGTPDGDGAAGEGGGDADDGDAAGGDADGRDAAGGDADDEGAAGGDAVTPGPDPTPPGPDAEPPPPGVKPDERARRSIRSAPLEGGDPGEDPALRALREFEHEAFGPDGSGAGRRPWASDPERGAAPVVTPPAVGKEQLPAALRSPEHRANRPGPLTRPEEVRPDLPWLKGLKVGDLPVRWDPRVIRYLEFYKDDPRGRALMAAWVRRMHRYRRLVLEAAARHGLPADLLYVCMIESAFNPRTVSWAGASGLWQFVPSAASVYGLTIDYWVDSRNDPEKATEAALLMLGDLYRRFGTWELSLAAYNAGHGAVLSAIAKFNTNDFWRLLDLESGLPWASSIYVPKAMAAAIVGHNLEVFGFDKLEPAPAFDFERVLVPRSVSLSVVAAAAGVDAATIRDLNPELRRGRTPPGEYAVRIPRGRREAFASRFPQLRGDWDRYDAYVVRHGERFEDVARTHGLSVRALRELNGVDDLAELRGGTTIVVPRIDEETRRRNRALAEADLYHSDWAPGGPDDPMIVAVADKDQTVAGRRRVFYRVVAGDSLEGVAAALGVRAADLAAWNGLDGEARIQPRMVLAAYVDERWDAGAAHVALLDDARLHVVTAGSPEHIALVEGRRGRARLTVVAKRGETLESIGRRYGLKGSDMARINRRSATKPLAEGEALVVYQVVDREKARRAGIKVPPAPKGARGKGRGTGRGKPQATKPQAAKPASRDAKPQAAKPQAAKPQATKPQAAKPQAAKPQAAKPASRGAKPATGDRGRARR